MPTKTRTVKVPTQATLKKYGLTEATWKGVVLRQRSLCSVCELPLAERNTVIDHEHVRKWKRMKPEERRCFVRGVIHRFCNSHCVGRFMTLAKARCIVVYLEAYEARKAKRAAPGSLLGLAADRAKEKQ